MNPDYDRNRPWAFGVLAAADVYVDSNMNFRIRVRQHGSRGPYSEPTLASGAPSNVMATTDRHALAKFLERFNTRGQVWDVLTDNTVTGEVQSFKVSPPVPVRPKIERQ